MQRLPTREIAHELKVEKMMKRIIMITAVAAFALAAGAQAINVTVWTPAQAESKCTIAWDATFKYWTEQAQKAGDKYAAQAHAGKSLGIWSSAAHSLSAIAANREMTRENLIAAMEESSWFRANVLYGEQQTLAEACLANINEKLDNVTDFSKQITRNLPLSGEVARVVGHDSIALTQNDINVALLLTDAMVKSCKENDIRWTEMVQVLAMKALEGNNPEYPNVSLKYRFFIILASEAVRQDMESRGLQMYSKPLTAESRYGDR